ncbi:DUF5643 domain-containing protein [Bacillus sp. 1P06AnD]|uniref:DUF5643 domain-containing protein n=1 Tax=Bacillus sp. 1P06AnD TaxID=3132208 RepID=UPI0039A2BB87
MDDTRLTISYQIESDKPIPEDYFEHSFKVNGESKAGSMTIDNKEISPKLWAGFLSIEIYKDEFPKDTQIGITFEGKEGEVWEFTKQVTKQMTEKIEGFDYKQEKEGLVISVNKINRGPGGLLLTYTSNEQMYYLQSSIKFKVVDSYGKELKQLDGVLADGLGKNLYEPIDEGVTKLKITPYIELLQNDIERLSKEKMPKMNKIIFDTLTVEL